MKRILRKAVEVASPLLYSRFYSKQKPGFSWKGKQAGASITFDVEYARDAQVLRKTVELLESYEIRGSFACIGKLVEQFPKEHKVIVDAGHEVMNHTYAHPNHDILNPGEFFNKLSREKQEFEISQFEKTSEKILGVKPVGFRAPHFGDLNSRDCYEILEKRGYLYSSSTVLTKTHANGMPFFPWKENYLHPSNEFGFSVLELPVATCPKHYYSVFDSYHCYRTTPPVHGGEGEFYSLFKQALGLARAHGTYANFYFDPSDVVGRKDFEDSLEFLSSEKEFWTAACEDIAIFFKSHSKKNDA